MPLAIASPGAVNVAPASTAITPPAQNQTQPAGSVSTATVTPTLAPDGTKLTEFVKALGLETKLAGDLQTVASALVPSMQKIIEDRPDLALASFDFQSDNGALKVVSGTLGENDRAWLEQTLNANQELVDAVKSFHDDATTSYGLWADATNAPLSPADADNVSSLADTRFSFMSMLNRASQAITQAMDPNGTYTAANGAPIDFHQSVNSPLSFLVFQKSNQSVLDGTSTYTTSTGRTFHGSIKGNFFSTPGVIPGFLPGTSSPSLGVSAMA